MLIVLCNENFTYGGSNANSTDSIGEGQQQQQSHKFRCVKKTLKILQFSLNALDLLYTAKEQVERELFAHFVAFLQTQPSNVANVFNTDKIKAKS